MLFAAIVTVILIYLCVLVCGYFVSIILGFFLLFLASQNYCAYANVREDKRKATMGMYRTPENSLKSDAWLGGFCGLRALKSFNHKTRKLDFMESYRRRTRIGLVVQALVVLVLLSYGLRTYIGLV